MSNSPLPVIVRSIGLLRSGRACFSYLHLGEEVFREDGRAFKIFRQVVIIPLPAAPAQPGGVFRVWFRARASAPFTIATSWPAMLLFLGMQGLRAKTWLYDEAGNEFGGIYEWDTLEQAAAYGRSYAMHLSKSRSLPGQFSGEVFAPTDPRAAAHQAVRLSAA
jgi:hypothetical protein